MEDKINKFIYFVFTLIFLLGSCKTYQDQKYSDPPIDIEEIDLVGKWEVNYSGPGNGTDRLILKENGQFKQEYDSLDGYTFTTSWNSWRLEKYPDGRVYMILEGARYFDDGISFSEKTGIIYPKPTCPVEISNKFHDPIYGNDIEMIDSLVLTVRHNSDENNEIVLKHFFSYFEDGISSVFFRNDDP